MRVAVERHRASLLLIALALGCPSPTLPPSLPRPAAPTQLSPESLKPDPALLSAAEGSKADFVRDLAMLTNLDSGTDDADGLSQVSELLEKRLTELGAAVEVLPCPPAAGTLVHGTLRGAGRTRIMLLVHYDTVFGRGEAARRPFKVEGTRAFGPGVADAKGGVALIVHALQTARERGFDDYETLTILFNPDEEKSSLGSRDMIQALSAQQDYVLSYEPPDGERVIVATNGVAYVQLSVKGLASHAGSAPEKGRNAALELAGQVIQLQGLGDTAKGTTVNWTRIGTAFENRDGSWNQLFDFFPTNPATTLQLRDIEPRDPREE